MLTPANTGHAVCDSCGVAYDYAPDAPNHVCRLAVVTGNDHGIMTGMALAAAILVREFDSGTHALEILGAAGIDATNVSLLQLDDYDLKPLLRILAI